jgi:DHA1 family bicyclomycin/chloramphenicol resistance-like MFS transporter
MPKAAALALAEVPHVAGTGSAVLGAVQVIAGAAATPLVGLAGEHTAVPLAIVLASSAAIMGIACIVAHPTRIVSRV